MVFYFTGTGNSLYVAKQLEEKRISIPQAIHEEELVFEGDTIGVVCPLYGHEMPAMVKEFLRRAVFRTEYFYLVLTYGKRHGGGAELAKEFLDSCQRQADYINTIIMVDNYLPGFDMEEQLAINPEKKVEEQEVVFLMDRFGYARTVDTNTYARNKEAADAENKYVISCLNTGKICMGMLSLSRMP